MALLKGMKISYLCLYLIAFVPIYDAKVNYNTTPHSVVDIILKNLEDDEWDPDESHCLQTTLSLLNGVKNGTLWASWIWNSMQLPVSTFYGSRYHLGNFDQCLQVPWTSHPDLQMQYCLVDVKLTELKKYEGEITDPYVSAEKLIEMESFLGKRLNTLSMGVCLPSSCTSASIAKISRHIYQTSHLPFSHIKVDPRDCQVARQTLHKDIEFYVFWYVILFMTFLCLVAYLFNNTLPRTAESTGYKIIDCFNLTRNSEALFELQRDSIDMMHGMRAITSGIIVVAHYILMNNDLLTNHQNFEKSLKDTYPRLLVHLDILVDTFFVMSGMLHIKNLISSRRTNFFTLMCKRYLRFVTPFCFALLCFLYVLPHLGSGPLWPRILRKHCDPCIKNWWSNFLMMGNKIDGKDYCYVISWYIHCDYQLTILGTIFFLLYKRNKKSAFIIFFICYMFSALIPVFLNYWYEIPGVLFYDFGESPDMATNKVFNTTYVHSYTRASSYLVGVAMGYFITLFKPKDYRKAISKTHSILGFVFGISLMTFVLSIGGSAFNKEYTLLESAIYSGLDRSIWAIGICAIIAVCEYGTLPVINVFLSSKVFVPLSKLSYINYMFHIIHISQNLFSMRSPRSSDFYDMIINGLGHVVIAFSFSYLFWMFVEGPISNLTNLIFEDRGKQQSSEMNKKDIIHNGIKSNKSF